jgi:hypothetical protein
MALTGSGENINKQLQAENEHLKKLIGQLTIANDTFQVYSIIYYSPAYTYPVYLPTFSQMIKSFEVIPQNSSAATYENRNYGTAY